MSTQVDLTRSASSLGRRIAVAALLLVALAVAVLAVVLDPSALPAHLPGPARHVLSGLDH